LNAVPGSLLLRGDELVTLAVAVLVYAIGYMGLRQPEIFRYDEPEQEFSAEELPRQGPIENVPQPAKRVDARYDRSGLGQAEATKLKAALVNLMTTQQPFRDPDLTLSGLAEQLDTTPHKLSEVLNAELSQTFYDFVNSYRVEDVRRRLAEEKSKQVNVLTLAMDAGFASKSTFNQVFKKLTGQTPSTYRKALQLSP
jgi:AraC-like DNA-binding protein